jgi:ATP-binding cassette, subfamily B, multidrug efflux pump
MFHRESAMFGVEVKKARDVRATLRRFWDYFQVYRWALIGSFIMVILSTLMQVGVPVLTGQAVDCFLASVEASSASMQNCWYIDPPIDAGPQELIAGLGGLALLIVALYVASSLFSGLQFFLMVIAGQQSLRDMRRDIFQNIHRLHLGFFSRKEAGDIMSRLTNDTDTISQIIGFGLVSVVQGALLIGFIVIAMFVTSVPYALVSLVMLPLMFVATRWFSEQARKAFRIARREIGSVNANLQENIAAVREVQAFSRENENIEQFRQTSAATRDANVRAQAFTSALAPTLEALGYTSLALVAGVGGYFVISGQPFFGTTVSLGLIVMFIGYVQRFNQPVQQISVLWTNIQSAIAGGERIFEFLDEVPDIEDKPDAVELPEIAGHVRFENVWAEYNKDEPVLRGVSLEAQPGETIAIVGPTGAGKTTIINLLTRFYDVTDGRITIDNQDVRDVTRHSLRSQIGLVLQDSFLFSDTILNNIRYGRPEATEEEVMDAAKLAHAHDFITRLPEGYETVLGERGGGLSQGQRQLLAIARVALIDPRILILDEATSSVDTRTERQIQKALEKLLHGRTSFVIAHRLSTIRNADQVLFVKEGLVVERGRHEGLLAAQGEYYDLYKSQFRRAVEEAGEPEELAFGFA